MIRSLAAVALAVAFAAPAHATPLPPSPVKVVAEPGSCPAGYYDIGYVGPPGARWRICEGRVRALTAR